MKILYYRLLDYIGSRYRTFLKWCKERNKWGANWRDMTRPGRKYTRVDHATDCDDGPLYLIRLEPGWEWWCPNCHTYSLITASMMPAIMQGWAALALDFKNRGLKIPARPTAATAGCPECRYRPGAPE